VLLAACLLAGCNTLASRGAVVGCQAADTATTLHGLSQGAREVNPVVAGLIDKFGKEGFVAVKVGITLLVLHYYPVVSRDLLATVDGVTCGVAAHNELTARRLAKAKEQEKQKAQETEKP